VLEATFDLQALRDALSAVMPACPRKSPKPVLQNVLLVAAADGAASLAATDLEVSIRVPLRAQSVRTPGRCLLPADRLRSILAVARAPSVSIGPPAPAGLLAADEDDNRPDQLRIAAGRSTWDLPADDPDLYPALDMLAAPAAGAHVVAAADLARLIDRTAFATDAESTRYALGGCHLDLADDADTGARLVMVGTDGRRLAACECPCEADGEPPWPRERVLPLKALRLVRAAASAAAGADGAATARLRFGSDNHRAGLVVAVGGALVHTRLVEGRFPAWRESLPGGPADVTLEFDSPASLLRSVELARIAAGEDAERGVELELSGAGPVRGLLWAQAADRGEAEIRLDLPALAADALTRACLDPGYLADALRALGPAEPLRLELRGPKRAAVLVATDYRYVLMPLTSDRQARLAPGRPAPALAE
jgi:DNA polymerase-3 subunit beta